MTRVLGRRVAVLAAVALMLALAGGATIAPARAGADVLSATVSNTPTGQVMPSSFVGVSFEFRALHEYTGRDPDAVNPVLLALLRGLSPGQPPSIRIGGNSTDATWWPIRNMIVPGGVYYSLDKGWMRTTRALATDLRTKLVLGVNLSTGRPAVAAAEGRAFLSQIGRRSIQALEIGNEPDLYNVFPWFRDRRGHVYRARSGKWSLADYTAAFRQWAKVLPDLPLVGPGVSGPNWMRHLDTFIKGAPRLSAVTYHRYPLRACTKKTGDPTFPSIANLLADRSSAGLAAGLSPFQRVAARHKLPFRVAEMNSASCQGAPGVSDTFASALWSLDTMFNFARVGVQGVNFHMLPGSHYELFTTSKASNGQWQAFVHPEYYGLAMFAQAFPPGARLLPVRAPAGPTKVWATQAADGSERITFINQDPAAEHDVAVSVPGATATGALQRLTAPAITATSGVAIGGQTFGDETTTGALPAAPATEPIASAGGTYTVAMPAASAATLTLPSAGGGGNPLVH